MDVTLEQATVVHGEDGSHYVTLPCCGETVYVAAKRESLVCRSCHREIASVEQLASTDPAICVFCYTS